jgi:hypothetical protein
MKRFFRYSTLLFFLSFFSTSCIIRAPKYASVDQVFALKIGMTQAEISAALNLSPYALESKTDSETVFVYKYRTTDRRTLPLLTGRTNGAKAKGPYMDLMIAYGKEGKATKFKSKPSPKEEKSRYSIDVNSVFTLLTVSAPAALVYLGLQHK